MFECLYLLNRTSKSNSECIFELPVGRPFLIGSNGVPNYEFDRVPSYELLRFVSVFVTAPFPDTNSCGLIRFSCLMIRMVTVSNGFLPYDTNLVN